MRRLLILPLLLLASTASAQVQETITVARILLDARVTNYEGDPILGLEKDDFTVTVGGKRAQVESVTWVPETAAARAIAGVDEPLPSSATSTAGEETALPQGRLFVVFVQTDFSRARERVRGQMHFLRYAKEMVEALEPEDRLAVFSFDSHLKFRLDFTDDKTRVAEAIADSLMTNDPPPPQVVPNPSLARRLDREQMKKAATSEAALILVGNALRHIPGPKSLLLLGWGLGQLWGNQVVMTRKYTIARRALEAARVTVFSLDTTDAAYHSLEAGLQTAAKDTGGFYAKTHEFAGVAIARLHRTLAGHYEIEVRQPDGLRPGTHDVEVRVNAKKAYVLAPGSWIGGGSD